jgi:hypothetical protein
MEKALFNWKNEKGILVNVYLADYLETQFFFPKLYRQFWNEGNHRPNQCLPGQSPVWTGWNRSA